MSQAALADKKSLAKKVETESDRRVDADAQITVENPTLSVT